MTYLLLGVLLWFVWLIGFVQGHRCNCSFNRDRARAAQGGRDRG